MFDAVVTLVRDMCLASEKVIEGTDIHGFFRPGFWTFGVRRSLVVSDISSTWSNYQRDPIR